MSESSYNPARDIFDQSRQGIYVVSRESYEVLYMNDAMVKLGVDGAACGQKCYKMMHGGSAPCPDCKEHRNDGEQHQFHHDELNRDFMVETVKLVWDSVPAYAIVCSDVTERTRLKREKEREDREINSLVDSIPGGIAKYKVTQDGLVMLYCSAGLPKMLGMEMDEYRDEFARDWEARIYEADRPMVRHRVEKCVSGGGTEDLTYRLLRKDGRVLWVDVQGSLLEDEKHGVILHAVYHSLSAATELYKEMLDCSDTIIHVTDLNTRELLFANRAAAEFAGCTVDEMMGKKCYECMYQSDAPCDFCCQDEEGKDVEMGGRCYHLSAKRISWNGRDAFIRYMRDVTAAREYAKAEIAARNAALSAVDSALSGGTIISRPGLDKPLIYVSSNLERFLGYTREEFQRMYEEKYEDVIYRDDYDKVVELNDKFALDCPKNYEMEFRFVRKDGTVFWVLEKATYMEDFQGEPAYLSIFVDISRQKDTERALFERNATFDVLLENGGLSMWNYDIKTKTATLVSSKKHRRPMSMEGTPNYPESIIATGFINEESVEALRELLRRVDAGESSVSADIWYTPEGEDVWCDRITYVNIRGENGEIVRTVGIAENVTEQRLAQQQYEEELNYSESVQGDKLLAKVRCNLTKNLVESYVADGKVRVSAGGVAYSDGILDISAAGYTERDQELIRRTLDPARVLEEFDRGVREYSVDYRRRTNDGRVIWVNSAARIFRDLKSGDVRSFMYTTDINDKKVNKELITAVATMDRDYIALIYLDTDEFRLYVGNVNDTLLPKSGITSGYAKSVADINRASVCPEDVERCICDILPDSMRKNLSKSRLFSGIYRVYDGDKQIRYKKIQYSWLNETLGQVVMTRSDVTDVVLEQARQQELLRSALDQAERASNAKTDFLSKMSHEIRTPMNAIIGLSAFAEQNADDSGVVGDCMAKVGISARYLLTLINDILDMSRIESGKLSIRHDEIPFEEFISGVNTVISGQAADKGITYDTVISGFVEDYYVGDAMKLQQVLVNLLGNAVKFTGRGGKVQLIISQERVEKGVAHMKFMVSDTGCGISEEFQKTMFSPFEQEHDGSTTSYGGTGLGLAISKNLVELMNGCIYVNSILGVGTEFTVRVPLGECLDKTRRRGPEVRLETLSALVVDDEALICEQVHGILDEMGMKAEWVTSGGSELGLTGRELEIAQMAAQRLTNREIGEALHLSEGTVKNQLRRIFDKLEIGGQTKNKRLELEKLMPGKK